jgi:hypothetical protein
VQTGQISAARRGDVLVGANLLLVAVLVIHTLDHALRQTATVNTAGQLVGLLGFIVAISSLALAMTGGERSPLVTAVAGIGIGLGFVAVHLLPHWSTFSQPYSSIPVDTVSWFGLIIPALAAFGVGIVGLRQLPYRV